MAGIYLIGGIGPGGRPLPSVGGDCHNFIATLILHLFSVDCGDNAAIDLAEGHSHTTHSSYLRKYTTYDYITNGGPYDRIKKLDGASDTPLILFPGMADLDQGIDSWGILRQRHPDFKYINISFTYTDVEHILGNHFYKMHRFSPNSEYIPFASRPLIELSTNEARRLYTTGKDSLTVKSRLGNDSVPDQYLAQVYEIKFSDIMYNPKSVLTTLTRVTGKGLTPNIQELYNTYLTAQRHLISTYMPKIRLP